MTFEELKQRLCDTTLVEAAWHQHTNGGGWVQNTAKVDSSAQVYGNAQVSGDAWEVSPPYIQGTVHRLCVPKRGYILIGCVEYTIAIWQAEYMSIGAAHGYTQAQIAEYGIWIRALAAVAQPATA